jgi:hypothetical protein
VRYSCCELLHARVDSLSSIGHVLVFGEAVSFRSFKILQSFVNDRGSFFLVGAAPQLMVEKSWHEYGLCYQCIS